ncbi:hypothetical protein D3C81_1526660 [compost metagenome]
MRRLFFEVRGTEVDQDSKEDPQSVGMAESGTDRHLRLQTLIAKMQSLGYNDVEWIDVEDFLKRHPVEGTYVVSREGMEVKLRNTVLNLSFKCDGIIRFKNKYYVLEIKTETSFKWNPRTEPEDKARTQAASYSAALGVSRVLFLYENRDVCSKKVYIVEVGDQEIYERVVHKIETTNSYIEVDQAPPMTDVKKECNYCNYKTACKQWGQT